MYTFAIRPHEVLLQITEIRTGTCQNMARLQVGRSLARRFDSLAFWTERLGPCVCARPPAGLKLSGKPADTSTLRR